MDKSAFRLKMELRSRQMLGKMNAELKDFWNQSMQMQFVVKSENEVRLKESLRKVNRLDLLNKTLLTPDVHKNHHERLGKRLVNKYRQIKAVHHQKISKYNAIYTDQLIPLTDHELTDTHIRSFTLIDSVCVVDHQIAVQSALKMKQTLMEVVKRTKGISLLGVTEGEIISIKKMQEINDNDVNGESEKRKLDTCKTLVEDISNSVHYLAEKDASLFLIHFHGIVFAKQASQFEIFRSKLLSIHQWSKVARQIEIKKLSREWKGIPRTTEQNLTHIAKYIAKGGQDWNAGKSYLRYKSCMGTDNTIIGDADDWITRNARRQITLKQIDDDTDENGRLVDKLSLSVKEIIELTLFVDALMNLNRTRTGYLINAA